MSKTLPPPSLMMRKLLSSRTSDDELKDNQYVSTEFERQYCFVYGTLMDPETLGRVLRMSDHPPIMRRAKVIGYDMKLWGPYPALVDGEPLQPVNGMAFEILSQTQLDRLVSYETDKYKLEVCYIEILDQQDEIQTTIDGVTFMWNGEQDELREVNFDLKQWKKEKRLRELDELQSY